MFGLFAVLWNVYSLNEELEKLPKGKQALNAFGILYFPGDILAYE